DADLDVDIHIISTLIITITHVHTIHYIHMTDMNMMMTTMMIGIKFS
ncbi:MAG: hypothetical protein K0R54_4450, partial [Clostridiaceae bacterium]|nr:hypothetical protein [Clostridiaceae bacterium]